MAVIETGKSVGYNPSRPYCHFCFYVNYEDVLALIKRSMSTNGIPVARYIANLIHSVWLVKKGIQAFLCGRFCADLGRTIGVFIA